MQETHPFQSRDAHMPLLASPALVPADDNRRIPLNSDSSERFIRIRDPSINNMLNVIC